LQNLAEYMPVKSGKLTALINQR